MGLNNIHLLKKDAHLHLQLPLIIIFTITMNGSYYNFWPRFVHSLLTDLMIQRTPAAERMLVPTRTPAQSSRSFCASSVLVWSPDASCRSAERVWSTITNDLWTAGAALARVWRSQTLLRVGITGSSRLVPRPARRFRLQYAIRYIERGKLGGA